MRNNYFKSGSVDSCVNQASSIAHQRIYRFKVNNFRFPKQCLKVFAFIYLLFLWANSYGQCPTPSYTIGSSTAYPKLSDIPAIATLTKVDIEVQGTFTIDEDATWTLEGVNVHFSTNTGAIIVEGGSTLYAHKDGSTKTVFDRCGSATAWDGITVDPAGIIKLDDCEINNACTAVDMNNCKFSIVNNSFNSNFISINVMNNVAPIGDGIANNNFDIATAKWS